MLSSHSARSSLFLRWPPLYCLVTAHCRSAAACLLATSPPCRCLSPIENIVILFCHTSQPTPRLLDSHLLVIPPPPSASVINPFLLSSLLTTAASANPTSDQSSGTSSGNGNGAGNSNSVAPPSKSSRKNPMEAKTQKPSFLSLIFCCGANFVSDNDASLQVGAPTRPQTVSIGKAAGKKPIAGHLADEKLLPVQPAVNDAVATGAHEEPQGVSRIISMKKLPKDA